MNDFENFNSDKFDNEFGTSAESEIIPQMQPQSESESESEIEYEFRYQPEPVNADDNNAYKPNESYKSYEPFSVSDDRKEVSSADDTSNMVYDYSSSALDVRSLPMAADNSYANSQSYYPQAKPRMLSKAAAVIIAVLIGVMYFLTMMLSVKVADIPENTQENNSDSLKNKFAYTQDA